VLKDKVGGGQNGVGKIRTHSFFNGMSSIQVFIFFHLYTKDAISLVADQS
jgi:hypothetical protein